MSNIQDPWRVAGNKFVLPPHGPACPCFGAGVPFPLNVTSCQPFLVFLTFNQRNGKSSAPCILPDSSVISLSTFPGRWVSPCPCDCFSLSPREAKGMSWLTFSLTHLLLLPGLPQLVKGLTGQEGWKLNQSPMANDSIHHLRHEASIKTGTTLERLQSAECIHVLGEGCTQLHRAEAPVLGPLWTLPSIPLHLAVQQYQL